MTTVKDKDMKRSQRQAIAQMASIAEMVEALRAAGDNEDAREAAEQAIHESPLTVQVRSGWVSPGGKMEAEEYEILLCTGGPAVRIVGDLNEHSEPINAILEHQDWFTPWTPYHQADAEILLEYAGCFYFGD